MRRVVNVWLALLGAYWLTRAGASSLLFGRVDHGYPALLDLGSLSATALLVGAALAAAGGRAVAAGTPAVRRAPASEPGAEPA
jgi:hypothetical protein